MSDTTLWAELLAYGTGIGLSPIHIAVLLLLLLVPRPGDETEAEQGFSTSARRSSDHAGHGLSGTTTSGPAQRGFS